MARQQVKAPAKAKGAAAQGRKQTLKNLEARKEVKGGALRKGTGVADDSV